MSSKATSSGGTSRPHGRSQASQPPGAVMVAVVALHKLPPFHRGSRLQCDLVNLAVTCTRWVPGVRVNPDTKAALAMPAPSISTVASTSSPVSN